MGNLILIVSICMGECIRIQMVKSHSAKYRLFGVLGSRILFGVITGGTMLCPGAGHFYLDQPSIGIRLLALIVGIAS